MAGRKIERQSLGRGLRGCVNVPASGEVALIFHEAALVLSVAEAEAIEAALRSARLARASRAAPLLTMPRKESENVH